MNPNSPQYFDTAVAAFKNRDLSTTDRSNKYFEEYGIGNTIEGPSSSFERFVHYHRLLSLLNEADPNKFAQIHKGTPFFFLAWTAFDLHHFDAALHFLEVAMEEDRRATNEWKSLPGSQFVLLNPNGSVAARTVELIANRVSAELNRFSADHPNEGIDLRTFIGRFAVALLDQNKFSIVASFYSFLLEFDDRIAELQLRRSILVGSYQPIYLHLFQGGLILETILKERLAANRFVLSNPPGNGRVVLGTILQDEGFRNSVRANPGSVAQADIPVLCSEARTTTPEAALQTTGRLRNTMGHTLLIDPLPDMLDDYRILVAREVDAILYVIAKLYP